MWVGVQFDDRGAMGRDGRTREADFNRLYEAHYSAVRAYAWRRGPDTADDVVAETFMLAWRHLDRVPAEARPWLIGVARNVRLNQERGERRRREHEMQSARGEAEPSLAQVTDGDPALADALRRLSASDREVLLLTAWEDLDRSGLAMTLGCSKTAAAVRLHRARRRLATALSAGEAGDRAVSTEREGVFHGS
jgi:RNA polymerase sigma-70 factor (ECF subfamily)